MSIDLMPSLKWNWTYLCPTGLTPWIPHANYLTPCFQEICLQLPVFVLFAAVSSYHFGRQALLVARNSKQIYLIYFRIVIAFMLGALPSFEMYDMISRRVEIWPIEIIVNCTQSVTWIVHLGFLLALRSHGGISHRGPLFINVLWITVFLLACVWLRTSIWLNNWYWSAIAICLHTVYGLTLLPSGSAVLINRRNTQEEERQALLGNTYIRFQDDVHLMALGHAQDEAPCLSRLLFYWVNPLIDKGLMGMLKKVDDLFDLPESLSITNITDRFHNTLEGTRSLFRALHRNFGFEFYAIGILRFIADMSGFAGPILLAGLLNEKTTENTGTDMKPYFYALGLFGTTLLSSFCATHFNWRMALIGMKMRMGIVNAIYRKTLDARCISDSCPEVLNLMSTDTDRIVNSCISFHSFWSIPVQLFTTLYLLYTQIGLAFIAGLIFAAALIPINRVIANKIAALSTKLMEAKDERVSISSEALSGAKQLKLLAWEDVFIDKIQELRRKELSFLAKRKYLDALCVYFWATTPILMSLLTFGTATLLGHPLAASSTFASIALLNMLIGPLNGFPWIVNGLVEAWISLRRVQTLIDLPNIDLMTFYSPLVEKFSSEDDVSKPPKRPIVISLKNASFSFDKPQNREDIDLSINITDFSLESISFDVKRGDLICLEGPVGAGKTTLLSAILAGLSRNSGSIQIQNLDSGFGYVSQHPWLQRGTIRENIVWGDIFDESRYKKVLWACGLFKDLEDLGGDLTGVGEAGRTLSGGQRARVALARAVYQDKQIYVLDDILSAVDAHVTNHIVKNCILGLLKNKTRIIVTENRTLFYHANQILRVENGSVAQSDFAMGSFDSEITEDEGSDDSSMTRTFELNGDGKKSLDSVMLDETKEEGTLAPSVFAAYWKAMSPTLGFLVILSVILMQATRNLSDAWLAHWVMDVNPSNDTDRNDTVFVESQSPHLQIKISDVFNELKEMMHFDTIKHYLLGAPVIVNDTPSGLTADTSFYFIIYTFIAVLNSVITFGRAFIFAYAGIKAAKFIHTKLLNRVFYSRFGFFDITPLGRILNRFSSDTYTIDDSLPFILNILLAQLAGLIGAICISLYAMPWLALIIVPMCPVYLSLQQRYRHSSRDIKRLSSNSLSPLYAHFTETLQGLSTIRAMRAGNRFQRDFLGKLEDCIRAQLTSAAAQQWLALRLQFLGAVLVGGAGFVAAITSAHSSNPGMVGLAISYALSITGLLGGVLNALAETEQELVAVERVDSYCKLKTEHNALGSQDPPFGWPFQGVIKFDNVCLRYREHLPESLSNVDFQTSSCERIGIVGRTGAGKSSILAALLRVVPLDRGRITIDTADISTLPLHIMRSRIAIVPQEPFLFSGTIRENLDPRALHLDSELWNAITNCLATPLVQALGGLNGRLDVAGSNLSAGQKQLLCLSRALLRKSKIVVIDEGTSNLDSESESAIQLVLRNAFKSSTVLLIAHRLNGLQQVDRIFVMEDGKIVEQGTPFELSTNNESRFYAMLEEQQNPSMF